MWLCLAVVLFRGTNARTYGLALLLELLMVLMWAPPLYYLISLWPGNAKLVASTVIFGLNA